MAQKTSQQIAKRWFFLTTEVFRIDEVRAGYVVFGDMLVSEQEANERLSLKQDVRKI